MVIKTHSGIPLLDDKLGGVYSQRCFLVNGKSGSGKTVCGLQFIKEGLEQHDCCLYLTTMVANDLAIFADGIGFSMSEAIEAENLILLEYASFTGSSTPGMDMLPPEGFDQLRQLILDNSVKRVVMDTVLPWVCSPNSERIADQVFSFIRSFERLGVTTLMTIPQPVSKLAFRLKKALEDNIPISVILKPPSDKDSAHAHFTFQTVKYLGEKHLGDKVSFDIVSGKGIVAVTEDSLKTSPTSSPALPVSSAAKPTRVGFSQAHRPQTPPSQPPPPPPEPSPQTKPGKNAKLSTIWQPTSEDDDSALTGSD
jgi:KaiC/GvpD/RAD55 family RecA-like ATPase